MIKNETGFEYPAYDSTVDYKSLVYDHRVLGDWKQYKNDKNEIDIMFRQLEILYRKYPDPNYQWWRTAVSDRATEWKKLRSKTFFEIPKPKPAEEKVWLFITLNLNDSKLPEEEYAHAMKSIVDAILTSQDKTLKCYQMKMVLEKHREAGIHHHIHLLLIGNNKTAPSYMIQRLWRLSPIKQIIDSQNYIDIKTSWAKKYEHKAGPLQTCENYISGDKGTSAKLENVEKDKTWRLLNALEDEYNNL